VSRKAPLVPLKVRVPKALTVAAAKRPAGPDLPPMVQDRLEKVEIPGDKEIIIHIHLSYKAMAFAAAVLLQVLYVYGRVIAQALGNL